MHLKIILRKIVTKFHVQHQFLRCPRCEIFGFCLLSFCQKERTQLCSVCILFEESVFIFHFLNDKIYNHVKQNIIVNFIIQKCCPTAISTFATDQKKTSLHNWWTVKICKKAGILISNVLHLSLLVSRTRYWCLKQVQYTELTSIELPFLGGRLASSQYYYKKRKCVFASKNTYEDWLGFWGIHKLSPQSF